jgi:hypothetical protein
VTLADRTHDNFCGSVRLLARLERGSLLDEHGVCAAFGATDWPSSRIAVRTNTELEPSAWVATAEEFLLGDGRGQTASVSARVGADDDIAAVLTDHGFQEFFQQPQMVCEKPLPAREPPAGVRVRLAQTPADVLTYATIAGKAFKHLGSPSRITRTTLDNPEVMLQPDIAIVLADLDGEPVAGAMIVLVGDEPNGYVGWVSCVDEGRGRGLGDVVTRRVTNEAFARGAAIVSLEASKFGESTYARMGYREIARYRMLIKI